MIWHIVMRAGSSLLPGMDRAIHSEELACVIGGERVDESDELRCCFGSDRSGDLCHQQRPAECIGCRADGRPITRAGR